MSMVLLAEFGLGPGGAIAADGGADFLDRHEARPRSR
jgi:hypothetical protein